jgi:hypothetical protein
MSKDLEPKIIIKDLGPGARGVQTFGQPSNGSADIKNLRTRINAPAAKKPTEKE